MKPFGPGLKQKSHHISRLFFGQPFQLYWTLILQTLNGIYDFFALNLVYIFIRINEKPYTPAVCFSAAVEATEFQSLPPQLDPTAGAMQGQNTREIQLKQIHITPPSQ